MNRHLNPLYGAAADSIWSYKTDWEAEAERIMGSRHATHKVYTKASVLHHANAAQATIFHCFVEWHKLRDGAPRADDVTAMQYLTQTILDDFYLVPVPGTAPKPKICRHPWPTIRTGTSPCGNCWGREELAQLEI